MAAKSGVAVSGGVAVTWLTIIIVVAIVWYVKRKK